MQAIGFDPAFLDILLFLKDKEGYPVSKLPEIGFHHRHVDVSKVAGGNGVNIAFVLKKLGMDFHLVVPSDDSFDKFIAKRNLQVSYRIHEQVNETFALMFANGEVQINHARASLGKTDWDHHVHRFWVDSPAGVSVNWSLNPKADEWVACQWLSSCGWSFEEISEDENVVDSAISEKRLSRPFFLEPGSIKDHQRKKQLHQLLKTISSTSFQDIFPLLSCNEEEHPEFSNHKFPSQIMHAKTHVSYDKRNDSIDFPVEPIANPQNLVGAGDAFLAGLIFAYFETRAIDVEFGILTARKYILNDLP